MTGNYKPDNRAIGIGASAGTGTDCDLTAAKLFLRPSCRLSQLTKRAGQLGESERLGAAGHQRADFALSAAHAILFKRAKSPQYWPFSPGRVNTPSTGGAEELEVEGSGSPKETRKNSPSVDNDCA